ALVRRACELLLAAGEAALDRAAYASASTHLERALELAADSGHRAAALLLLARTEILVRDSCERALELLDEVDRLLPAEAAEQRAESLAWRSRAYWLVGRSADSLAAAN